MNKYPVAYADKDYEGCAQVIVNQLERRADDPIRIMIGDMARRTPTCFHRSKETLALRKWSWKAVDEEGREVRSGVVHDTAEDAVPPTPEDQYFENLAVAE